MAFRTRKRPLFRVVEPTFQFLHETEASKTITYEPDQSELLATYGYEQREYLMSGVAARSSYCTRVLLRRPADPLRFSGLVIEEPAHLWGGTTVWRLIDRWIMRNGHAWLGVDSQGPAAIDQTKRLDPDRYKEMHFKPCPPLDDFMKPLPRIGNISNEEYLDNYGDFKTKWSVATSQSPEILTAASHGLRNGNMEICAMGIILCGHCQSGDVVRNFIIDSSHLHLPGGHVPFEGYMPCQSDGGPALLDMPNAKIIEVFGEQDILWTKNLYGTVEEPIPHRRFDSGAFRLYEVPGLPHRESRYISLAELKRLSGVNLLGTTPWTTFGAPFLYSAIFDSMARWISAVRDPPRSALIATIDSSEEIERDIFETAIGGVRTVHTDVPVARTINDSPKDRPHWFNGKDVAFTPTQMLEIYKSLANFRRQAADAIYRQVVNGFLLPEDAEILRRDALEHVTF